MIIHYDSSVDALDIRLLSDVQVAHSIDIDDRRIVDLDETGQVVSIEVMGASQGFEVTDLIERYGLDRYKRDLMEIAQGRLPVG